MKLFYLGATLNLLIFNQLPFQVVRTFGNIKRKLVRGKE